MKLLFDLLPIILFFAAYKLYDIFVATAVAMAAIILQISFTYLRGKKPDLMQWITLLMVVFLGGATLLLRDEMFIKLKPTVVYWLLALVFAGSRLFYKKTLVQKMLEKSLDLPKSAWNTLNASWYSFFLLMGLANLFVVYMFDTNTWVNFKLFGTLFFTLLFVIMQGILVSRWVSPKPEQN